MSGRAYVAITASVSGDVATLTMNRPERRNAIGPRMINELLWALKDASEDAAVRTVVLTGAGKTFCSGGDFAEMSAGGGDDPLPVLGDYPALLLALMRSKKPIVARVNGHAMGGGLGLVAASTFAIASTDAQLGTPEVDVGLFPMMIMAVLAKHVPRRRLLEMMLFGERISADEAAALHLLNRAVPAAELDAALTAVTEKVAKKSAITIALGLDAFAAQDDLAVADALPMLRERLAAVLATDDAREGLTAFLEKRAPKWTGK